MKRNSVPVALLGAVSLWAGAIAQSAPADATRREATPAAYQTVNVFRTNQTTRFITNVIEVRAPNNVFVNEYRTNWFQQTVTNVVHVPRTNWTSRTITNVVAVNLIRTNVVERRQTNLVDRYRTNWVTQTMTNHLDEYRTNWLTLTLTNHMTLNLTNWETVLVTRTNWIPQALTNYIEANVPFATAVLVPEQRARPEPKPELSQAEAAPDSLVIEAVKSARPLVNNEVEVIFKVRLAKDPAALLAAPQWNVERDDGAVLFVAQTQEFSRRLPPGQYTVQVKARRGAGSPLLAVQSVLDVSHNAVARK